MTGRPAEGAAVGRVIVARARLDTSCARCTYRIDRGDRYRIQPWLKGGGFDYLHEDCDQTHMREYLRNRPGAA